MFQKLLDIINHLLPRNPLAGKEEALAQLDPQKIYVENVRSLLNVSHSSAKDICETAVRQGLFSRRIEVMCPDGAVAITAASEEELPVTVECLVQEDGEVEPEEVPTRLLKKNVFYRLNERTSVAHA